MGAVSQYDVRFLCDIVEKYRPKNVFELGVASGMSSSFLLRALARVSSDCKLFSVDLGTQYYVDRSKLVGYLIDEIVPVKECEFEIHRGCWAGDAEKIIGDDRLDLIFIDANHMHPWPTIDTVLLLPFANPNAIIAHHDIALWEKEGREHGIGPFHIFDEFPEPKFISQCKHRNIGAFQITQPLANYEPILLKAMHRDWTISNAIRTDMFNQIVDFVEKYYSADFCKQFVSNLEENNTVVREKMVQKKSA